MKRLIKLNDAKILDPSIQLDANEVLNKVERYDNSLTPENLLTDVNAGSSAIYGLVSDDSRYVVELYSYKGDISAIAYCELENGVPNTGSLDIMTRRGVRSEIKNNMINDGLTLNNGEKITFEKQLTKPVDEEIIE